MFQGNPLHYTFDSYLREQKRVTWHVNQSRYVGSHEVDVVVARGESLVPVEVKDSNLKMPEVPEGVTDFAKAFRPRGAIVMNRDFAKEAKTGTPTVTFLPTAATLARPDLLRELLTQALR